MAIIKSFKAVRPTSEYASKVAALPYDVMNADEARNMVKGNPYSFLHVDKAEIDLEPNIDPYDIEVYKRAKQNLERLICDNILVKDQKNCLYIYRLIMGRRAQTGLVCCTSIDDYINNVIKKHEHTREEKEKDRINHVDICDANTGPIFLSYKNNVDITDVIDTWTNTNKPEYYFNSEDGVIHTVWVVDDDTIISNLQGYFKDIESLYIADGHHRAASAVKVGLKRRNENPNFDGSEEFNYFMSVLFADEQLSIMDYNRVVKDLNNLLPEDFLEKVKEKFMIEKYTDSPVLKPYMQHIIGMYLDNQWYKLKAKPDTFDATDPVERLDVSILQNNLLEPILAIQDPRTDDRIDFIGGIRGLKELEKRTKTDMRVAFAMYPTSIEELMFIADNNCMMPPKSTWFEPKLRSGLFIHMLT